MLASQAAKAAPDSCRKWVTCTGPAPRAAQKKEIAPPETPNACRTPSLASPAANSSATVMPIRLSRSFQAPFSDPAQHLVGERPGGATATDIRGGGRCAGGGEQRGAQQPAGPGQVQVLQQQ